ncbi:MAG: hypothetical protein M3Z01_02500 [Thermoproteota archaeon]|nr:hypothetical protein [Thermoproteota archaeon]
MKVSECLVNWAKKSHNCNGDINCLEENTKELRDCLDIAFPPSTKLEFESDKINYVLSTIFFLSNRLAKSMIGLSEIDKAINDLVSKEKPSLDNGDDEDKGNYQNMEKVLNEILAKYF